MKQLQAIIIMSFLLSLLNCKTTPPVQFQENKQDPPSLIVVGSESSSITTGNVDINEGQTTYTDMNEKTFMNLLNADLDKLSLIEGIWSNEKNTYKVGIQKAKEKGKYFAFILNSQEPHMKKSEIIAEFYKTRYEYIYSTEYYLDDKTKIFTKSYLDEHGMLLIFLHEWEKESIAFFRSFPVKEALEEKEKVSDLEQSLVIESETGNDENYVQVGAWKNHNYAQHLLVKIKKYYPKAYIVVHNDIYKIRIPDVLTKKQGAILSTDIENKFNIKPIFIQKKQ